MRPCLSDAQPGTQPTSAQSQHSEGPPELISAPKQRAGLGGIFVFTLQRLGQGWRQGATLYKTVSFVLQIGLVCVSGP